MGARPEEAEWSVVEAPEPGGAQGSGGAWLAPDRLEFWSNHGLDYRKVSEFLDLDTEDLSKIGGVSKRSVRLDSRIPHDLAVSLERIANICALVAGYFEGDIDKTVLWFRTPNPMLGGISPRDMIRFGRSERLLKFVTEARDANSSSAAWAKTRAQGRVMGPAAATKESIVSRFADRT